jgi:hypothetical protein
VKPRHGYRLSAKVRANAALCGLPITDYLALPRRERKRRVRAAREEAGRG